jgi:hypothetical protein
VWIVAVEAGIELWFHPAEQLPPGEHPWVLQLPVQGKEYRQLPVAPNMRAMLKYDEGLQAEWRDIANRPWQLFYFRWLPRADRYRAIESTQQARGHAADLCLTRAGMSLETNLPMAIVTFNGTPMRTTVQRFLTQERPLHVFTGYWQPYPQALHPWPRSEFASGLRQAWHAFATKDRGRSEMRVFKIGVWNIENDEEAVKAFREYLGQMIVPAGGEQGARSKEPRAVRR